MTNVPRFNSQVQHKRMKGKLVAFLPYTRTALARFTFRV